MPGRLGVDKGKGMKLMILPPGWSQEDPDGDGVLESDTFGGYVLFRSNMASHSDADVAKVGRLRQADQDLSTVAG